MAMQMGLHASEGGMYMSHEDTASTMKDGVRQLIITNHRQLLFQSSIIEVSF
jgi:hypothetical protein